MLKFYGRETSSNSQKVLWLMDELGIAYVWIRAGREYGKIDAAINPNRRVPAIDEDGFILWESNAILAYFCDSRAPDTPYWPKDPKERADIDRWLNWQQGFLRPALAPLYQMTFRDGPLPDPAVRTRKLEESGLYMGILDRHLEGRRYVCWERLTLAEFAIALWAHRWYQIPDDKPETPNVEVWYERLKAEEPKFVKWCCLPPG